ncbi:MAG: HD domain-containing protein [Candidatus Omnitrophica bacterium]|nr:HD domain-containing protein [Candidatus Omnitrophota bacterium]
MKKEKKKQVKAGTQKKPDEIVAALDFFAEAGLLKRIKRSGWWVAGIDEPESVAEHSFRTAVMGFYLAYLEDVDPLKVISMTLFNDIHESRINDLHKMGHYYIDFKDAEKKVFKDQVENLDKKVKKALEGFRQDYDEQETKESIVARDADILECLIQAKEYYDHGHQGARLFFDKAPDYLKTKSARKMWQKIKKWDSSHWWQDIVKFER